MRLHHRVSKSAIALLLLGCFAFFLYRISLRATFAFDIRWVLKLALVQSVLYLLAVWVVFRSRTSRTTLIIVLGFAILFRLGIVFAPPYLSDDIYRYVWDGRVQAAGINPYRYVPAAPELANLRDDAIYPRINRRDSAPTIYPPLAQAIFFLTTRVSEDVRWMKLTMLGFEIVAVWALVQLLGSFGFPRQRVLVYAWHPLVVWELAGSGHVDAISIALIALAFLAWRKQRNLSAGVALAGATLVKLFPLVLLPSMLERKRPLIPLIFLVTVVVAYVPYLSVGPKAMLGYLPGYAVEQGLDSGEQFYFLSLARKLFGAGVPSVAFLIVVAIVMCGIACWTILRLTRSDENLCPALVLVTATTVLFAPHYSWYFAWLVPFLCLVPSAALFYLTNAAFLLYLSWVGDSREEMFEINSLIYVPFLLIGAIEIAWRRYRSSPGSQRVTGSASPKLDRTIESKEPKSKSN